MDTTVDKLRSIKVHPRQSFEEVILELIKNRGSVNNRGEMR